MKRYNSINLLDIEEAITSRLSIQAAFHKSKNLQEKVKLKLITDKYEFYNSRFIM